MRDVFMVGESKQARLKRDRLEARRQALLERAQSKFKEQCKKNILVESRHELAEHLGSRLYFTAKLCAAEKKQQRSFKVPIVFLQDVAFFANKIDLNAMCDQLQIAVDHLWVLPTEFSKKAMASQEWEHLNYLCDLIQQKTPDKALIRCSGRVYSYYRAPVYRDVAGLGHVLVKTHAYGLCRFKLEGIG